MRTGNRFEIGFNSNMCYIHVKSCVMFADLLSPGPNKINMK